VLAPVLSSRIILPAQPGEVAHCRKFLARMELPRKQLAPELENYYRTLQMPRSPAPTS